MSTGNLGLQNKLQKENVGFFKKVELIGNKLPHPFILFIYLAFSVMILSAILAAFEVSVIHPVKKEVVFVKSLLTQEGLQYILTSMIKNFSGFPSLGLALGMTLGIGLAERVGLIQAVLRKMVLRVPARLVTFTVVLAGFLAHLASDAAFILIPPMAAIVFLTLGRHPLAGLAAGYAAVGSGFTANIFIGGTDALLSGISTQVAKTIDPNAMVTPVDNWFFMAFSTLFLSFLVTIVTEKFVEPRLGTYQAEKTAKLEDLTIQETKALRVTGIVAAVYVIVLALLVLPEGALLRDVKTGGILNSPFMSGIIPIILMFFITVAATYGVMTGEIKSQKDIPKFMSEALREMTGFIVMVFAAAQFIAFFDWSNIAVWMAVSGADFLKGSNITGLPVLLAFSLLTAFLSLFIFSGSALWTLLAPVFIPMFMLIGFHPAFVQLAYRIAESATNTIAPLNPYMPIVLLYMQEYKKESGVGTLIAMMMPYALLFLGAWMVLIVAWYFLGIPIGPGVMPNLINNQ
ncbi:AbgT family transporter [Brevibacillus sp. NRS-1366]|uniref:AbgT family transporter n=1 Tax=Brevibacillus sp. NRS-1366 TaxID=3233899 RepID=UPI003D1D1887